MPISFQMDIHLEMMHAIGEVQDAPVVADIDTGFGNAVNVAYVIPRYAAAGVAAVVIEDKTFPKDSSLRAGGRQELVPIGEFQGKLAAAKAAGAVLVIARTEALIAGLGQDDALRRGEAYAEAGADGVLIHSKQKTPDEVLAFCRAWPGRVPLVLVPTSYPQLSFADVAALGKVGLIICGNHAIRAAVAAMQSTFRRILAEGGIAGVESDIASVAEVFALQGDEHMRKLEGISTLKAWENNRHPDAFSCAAARTGFRRHIRLSNPPLLTCLWEFCARQRRNRLASQRAGIIPVLALPRRMGPRIRIRFPPARSQERTVTRRD